MSSYYHFSITILPAIVLSFLVVLVTSLCIILSVNRRLKNRHDTTTKKPPPGKLGFPWIGETFQFFRAQQKNRLLEDFILPRIEKHGKTFKTRLMGSPTVIINGADANRFFLSNEFKLVVSSWPSSAVQLMGRNSIMNKTGDQHKCIRAVISQCLGSAGLETLVPKILSIANAHLVETCGETEKVITLYRSAKFFTFRVVCECLWEMEATEKIFECFERVLEGVFSPPVNVPGTSFWRAKRARATIEKVFVNAVRTKRREMEKRETTKLEETTLLSRLVGALIRGEISEVEVVDNMVLLIFAAHDTTSFAIAMTFRMLAENPACFSQLLTEHMEIRRNRGGEDNNLTIEDVVKMKYTWQVARETIRLFPPIFGSFRRAIQDIEFDGFTIPKGWKVLWTAYGTHYNEDYFVEPGRFDPSRFEDVMPPYVFVPFGGGPRICAGYQLAKLNILIFVHLVVTRYNWSLVRTDEPIVMDPLPLPSEGMAIRISPKETTDP